MGAFWNTKGYDSFDWPTAVGRGLCWSSAVGQSSLLGGTPACTYLFARATGFSQRLGFYAGEVRLLDSDQKNLLAGSWYHRKICILLAVSSTPLPLFLADSRWFSPANSPSVSHEARQKWASRGMPQNAREAGYLLWALLSPPEKP